MTIPRLLVVDDDAELRQMLTQFLQQNGCIALPANNEADIRKEYTASSSMRRFVEPDEIADMAVFLASPAAAMVSGQAMSVDGNTEVYRSE